MASKLAELTAVLYAVGDDGILETDAAKLLTLSLTDFKKLADTLKQQLDNNQDSGLTLIKIGSSLKLVTSPACSTIISKLFQKAGNKNLSQSAMEILAIIAYRQPITRIEIDELRGVNSSGALQTLLWRGLIKVSGKKEVPGHPNLYVTSPYFLQYFDYQSLDDLPSFDNFTQNELDGEPLDLFNLKDQGEN